MREYYPNYNNNERFFSNKNKKNYFLFLNVEANLNYFVGLNYVITINHAGDTLGFALIEAVTFEIVIKSNDITLDKTPGQITVDFGGTGNNVGTFFDQPGV